MNSEFWTSGHFYQIQLQNSNGRIVILMFMDSMSVDLLDETIRNIFHIKQNQLYTVSYTDKYTGKNIYIITDGQLFARCVMMGIETLNVEIRPSVSQLPSASPMSKDQTIKNNKTSNQRQSEPIQNNDDRIMHCTSRCDESDENCSRECLVATRPSWLSLFNDATARMWFWIKGTDTKYHLMHAKSD